MTQYYMIRNQVEVEQLAFDILQEMAAFCRDEFELPDTWVPLMQLDFSKTFLFSRGGVDKRHNPTIKIAARRFLFPVAGHVEYPAFSASKTIGAFVSDDWQLNLRAIIAHEIAHCVQFTIAINAGAFDSLTMAESHVDGLGRVELNHGTFFRRIYKILRREFVNLMIPQAVKGINPAKDAIAPDSIRRVKRDTKHPMVHQAFNHPEFGPCIVTEHRVNGRKYKFTIEQMMTRQLFKITTGRLILFGCKVAISD